MTSGGADHIDTPHLAQLSDVTHLLSQDTTPWYKKKNLRKLYATLVPAALGVEMTSGYDGSVLNGLQAVVPWNDCEYCLGVTRQYLTFPCRFQQSERSASRPDYGCFLDRCCYCFAACPFYQRQVWTQGMHLAWEYHYFHRGGAPDSFCQQ